MQPTSLVELGEEQLAAAREAASGRAAHTLHGGREHALRQTLISLVAGHELSEHESPGEATLHVIQGEVVLVAGDEEASLSAGDHVAIPPRRHGLSAVTDSVVLLTVMSPR